jgi:hypothetical protein
MTRRARIPHLLAFALLLAGAATGAAAPQLVNYQGILADAAGAPLEGSHDLTFRIYPDSLAGTALWSEDHPGVTVEKGLFQVILGGAGLAPLTPDLFDGGERWLGITVDGGDELSPRMRLTSVPWALRAAVADSVRAGGLLPLRLSQAERDAIANPVDGMVIFNTDTDCLNFYAVGAWRALCGDCLPDCTGRECGDDGCGGSCGTCPPGMHCEDGTCVCDVDYCEAGETGCITSTIFRTCVEDANGCGDWEEIPCDDGNPCTIDSCHPVDGCQWENVPDGTACGTDMYCLAGNCVTCQNNGGATCAGATDLGGVAGDESSSPLTTSGCGDAWLHFELQEGDGITPEDLLCRVRLDVPLSSDYDLHLYAGCGNLVDQDTGTGSTACVEFTITDNFGFDDSQEMYVEIRSSGLPDGDDWTLTVEGNVLCP